MLGNCINDTFVLCIFDYRGLTGEIDRSANSKASRAGCLNVEAAACGTNVLNGDTEISRSVMEGEICHLAVFLVLWLPLRRVK